MVFNRNTFYGLIHKGFALRATAEAGLELTRAESESRHRQWLERKTGKRSCRELTNGQLQDLVDELRRGGWLENSKGWRPGGRGESRPTDAQWRKLAALSKARGWNGLDAPELARFVLRTAKLSGIRFLTKATISQVITGLEKWRMV